MARTKRKLVVGEPGGEAETEAAIESTTPPGEEASFFDSRGDDSVVLMFRRHDTTKRLVYHGKLSPAEATEETVAATWGGGEYLAREKVRSPDGRMVFGRQRMVMVAGPYKEPTGLPPAGASAQAAAPVAAPSDALSSAAAGVNMEDIKMAGVLSLLQMTQQAAQAQVAAQAQMQQMLVATMDAQRQGMEAIVRSMSQRKEEPRENPMEMMKAMAEMLRGINPTPKSEVKELMEGMRSILDFRDELAPAKPSSGDTLMDSVPKMLDLVKEGFALKRQGAAPVAAPATALPGATAEPVQEGPMWQRLVLGQKRLLLRAAQENKDPEVAALMVVEFLPEGMRGALDEFIRREDVVDQVFAVVPELREYQRWTGAFLGAVRQQVVGDLDDAGDGGEDADPSD